MDAQPQERATDGSAATDEEDTSLPPAGDDVRVGPEQSGEPEAGATEPPD